jgi:hypothetical protein
MIDVALTPFTNGLLGGQKHLGNLTVAVAFTCQKNDTRTHGESLRSLGPFAPRL